jgi:tetratricopeptide (TPR) repeat protein
MWGQATPAPEKKVKDRAEYDLYDSITKEQNPTKRLEFLNTWKEKYAETDYKKERLLFYLTTYVQLNQPAKVIETAKQVLEMDPKDFTSLYYISLLTTTQNDTSPGAVETGEKAAQGMLANLDTTFAKEKKPATTSDADWTKARTDMEAIAHKTLGWVGIQKKQFDTAEQEFKKELALNPTDAQASYWLGQSIGSQKKLERTPEALWDYARAATYDGPGALPPEFRKQVDEYLQKAYKGWHGGTDGLAELKAQAKTTALPPADFKIASVKDLAEAKLKKEQEEEAKDPQKAIWKKVKDALMAADGAQYFESSVKGAALPKLKGKLVSQTPAIKPKTLVLALSDDTTPEVTLNLSAPLAGKADAGTVIEFEGVPSAFTQSPFMVTMDVEKEKIEGWPAQAAPAHRPATGTKAGAKKKK